MKDARKLTWRTETRKVSELVPNEKNPRVMSAEQIENLKKSLERFNLVEIPVIDTDNRVLAGHQRLMVMKILGREGESIPVRVPDRKLTRKECDEYLLTSNRVHAEWDWSKLGEHFDIETMLTSGFDDGDLSNLFDDVAVEDDEFDVEKELKKIGKPKARPGDLYQLGRHRLHCADSTDPKAVEKLMAGRKANVILQDPPFNISLSYDKGIGGTKQYGGHVDDSKTDEQYGEFLRRAIRNGLAACGKAAHVFTYCDQRYIWLLQTLYRELGVQNKRVCLWIKNNSMPTPQVAFNKQYEPCVYGTVGRPYFSQRALNISEIMNAEVGTGNRSIEDILDMIDVWLVKRLNAADYEHPTQKPPQLHEKALRRCTRPDDVVLDLFAGSGSLMVACEQLKRSAYMVEREPVFVDLIIRRYEKLSNSKAKKLG